MNRALAGDTGDRLKAGTPGLLKANGALFAGGFATFALLYCVQPLLPIFSETFGTDAAESSLSLSLATGTLAVSMLAVSSLADAWGRKGIMGWSLVSASLLSLLAAAAPNWPTFLFLRALVGLSLAGLPAVAMAYLAEEVEGASLGVAMGLYISGNALGGMAGRLISGILADFFSWRIALGAVGLFAALSSAIFWVALPRSRHFVPRKLDAASLISSFGNHLREPGLRKLFAVGFVLMGCFVTVYNYIGYHLTAAPYGLRPSTVAFLFTVYLVGAFTSTWAGRLSGRYGRRKILWPIMAVLAAGVAMTLSAPLPLLVAGIILVTGCFFAGHSVASSWIGRRAHEARAQASGLYLFFYYAGGSIVGWMGGHAWNAWKWPGVACVVGALALSGLALAWNLRSLPRLSPPSIPETEPAEPAS